MPFWQVEQGHARGLRPGMDAFCSKMSTSALGDGRKLRSRVSPRVTRTWHTVFQSTCATQSNHSVGFCPDARPAVRVLCGCSTWLGVCQGRDRAGLVLSTTTIDSIAFVVLELICEVSNSWSCRLMRHLQRRRKPNSSWPDWESAQMCSSEFTSVAQLAEMPACCILRFCGIATAFAPGRLLQPDL